MDHRPPPVQYPNGVENNLGLIADQICSKPPLPPCSIQLLVEPEQADQTQLTEISELEILTEFTLACLHKMFGPNATPCDLSVADFDRLNLYVHSIGYHMNLVTEETESSYRFKISFVPYKSLQPNPLGYLKAYM
jgi:hypothetical protein